MSLFFLGCLHTVKPLYKVERFEAATRPKAEIAPESLGGPAIKEMLKKELSKYIDLSEFSETDRDKIQIVLNEYSFPIENDNSYGKIGLINLCILFPCWKTYQSGVSVEYKFNGKTEKKKMYGENKTLWYWLPFVFYNIFTLSSEVEEYEKANYLKFLNSISPNIAKTILAIENENKPKIAEHQQKREKELSKWESVNKNSVRNIVHFLRTTTDVEIEKQAEGVLNNLLDKKVQTHLVNRYPFIKPYLKNMILYPDGENVGRGLVFFEIFTRLVLEKDSETGFKQDVKLFQKDGKIIWEIEYQGETHLLYFVPYKNNITLEKISRDGITMVLHYRVNGPNDGIFRAGLLYGTFSAYPLWKNIDTDFLDSFK